jgi:hypothetical protein
MTTSPRSRIVGSCRKSIEQVDSPFDFDQMPNWSLSPIGPPIAHRTAHKNPVTASRKHSKPVHRGPMTQLIRIFDDFVYSVFPILR